MSFFNCRVKDQSFRIFFTSSKYPFGKKIGLLWLRQERIWSQKLNQYSIEIKIKIGLYLVPCSKWALSCFKCLILLSGFPRLYRHFENRELPGDEVIICGLLWIRVWTGREYWKRRADLGRPVKRVVNYEHARKSCYILSMTRYQWTSFGLRRIKSVHYHNANFTSVMQFSNFSFESHGQNP